jgi:hypothetical protein
MRVLPITPEQLELFIKKLGTRYTTLKAATNSRALQKINAHGI